MEVLFLFVNATGHILGFLFCNITQYLIDNQLNNVFPVFTLYGISQKVSILIY